MSTSPPDAPTEPAGRPERSGQRPHPALIVGIVLVVVGLIGGGLFLATTGDDEEDADEGERTEQPLDESQEDDVSCGDDEAPCPTEWQEVADAPVMPDMTAEKALPLAPKVNGEEADEAEALDQLALEISAMTPVGAVEDSEAGCLASVVISVVGPAMVIAYDDHLADMADASPSSEDAAIASGAAGCVSGETLGVLRDDPNGIWPEAWIPGTSSHEGTDASTDGSVGCGSYQAGSAEVVVDLGVYIYCQTPQAVSVEDAGCLAGAIVSVLGDDVVVAGGFSPFLIHIEASRAQDDEVAAGTTSCLGSEPATAIRDEDTTDYWPDSWNPQL